MTVAPPAAWVDQAEAGMARQWAARRQRQAWRDRPMEWLAQRGVEVRGAAAGLFDDHSPEIVLAGPAGTGKSMAALFRVHHAMLNYPGARYLVLRKTARTLGSTTLATFEKRVAAPELADETVSWYGGSLREPASYRYANGSTIVVGGMDQASKLMSSEYDGVMADEATELTVTDWESAGTRLRNGVMPWQQQIMCCNPASPKHWIRERSTDGPLRMLHSRHVDNPAYAHPDGTLTEKGEGYLGRLRNLTGVRRLRLLDGIWAAAEGVIYEEWDDAIHLVDPFDPPAEWARWWSIDFGYQHPFVCQFWAEDPDGRLWLYREIVYSQRLVEDHARRILDVVAPGGQWVEPKPRAIICDHDAEGRATLERHLRMSTRPAKKTVTDGIQAVQARLRLAGDGRPRLFVMRGALVERDERLAEAGRPLCLSDEVGGYVWEPSPDGKPSKERPLKVDDDSADAMRYVVADRDLRGGVARLSRPTGSLR